MIPPPPTPRRPDHDHRPSMRMLVAASMLRHGHNPRAVAEATAVPLALVDLIGDQLDTHPATSPPPPATHRSPDHRAGNDIIGADPRPPATSTNMVGLLRAQQRHARRRALIAAAALMGWVINLGLSATADIIHLPTLGVTSLILAPLLVVVFVLNATSRSPRRPRTHRGAPPR
jgi:hypothetical protein